MWPDTNMPKAKHRATVTAPAHPHLPQISVETIMKFIEEPSKRRAPRKRYKLATPEEGLGGEMNFNCALEAWGAAHEKGWEPCGRPMAPGPARPHGSHPFSWPASKASS